MTTVKQVHLIATGGTIDSYYDTDQCTPVCLTASCLLDRLREDANIASDFITFEQLMMKDSRDVSDADRDQMVEAILASQSQAIVMTHGSFTLFETARYLEERLKDSKATVVITGALRPITGFSNSDGLFNLGCAIVAAQMADNGVHVCIEGRLMSAHAREVWH